MNNNPKNDIAEEYQLFPLSDVDNRSKRRNMLIRHDYYSADSAHGRSLLESVFEAIEDSDIEIETVYLIDSGVKLCSEDSSLYNSFLGFVTRYGANIFCCSSSIETYSIRLSEQLINIICVPSYDFFTEIIQEKDLIIID